MHFDQTKLSDDDIAELAIKLKVDPDNKIIKDELTMAFVIPASAIASHYHKITGLDQDDLQGEALLGVVDAVNRFHNIKHNNIGGYINRYVHQHCRKFIKRFTQKNVPLIDNMVHKRGIFFDSIILFDILDSIVKTEIERKTIKLRIEGLNDLQIGEIFGGSRQYVWHIRKILFDRYRRLSSE